MLASIPSPAESQLSLGPVEVRAYALLVGLGVLAGVWLASRRLARDGYDPDIAPNLALWVVPAAVVGARAYHVLTTWDRFSGDLAAAFRFWEGGLGLPGGVALGTVVGAWWLRRNEVPLAPVLTAAALGLPLGQIIGRFGNWFNQELYGRPTDLPWGLEIDEAHRLAGYESNDLFHPTFAYEMLWNAGLLAVLIRIDRKGGLRPGALFATYLVGYGVGRILIETVRIDPVSSVLGIRLPIWVMVAVVVAALLHLRRHGRSGSAADVEAEPRAGTEHGAPGARPGRAKRPMIPASEVTRRARGSARPSTAGGERATTGEEPTGDSGVTVKDLDRGRPPGA